MIVRRRAVFIISTATVILMVFAFLPERSSCWNFQAVGLPEDVLIWKFAVWRNRAFLAVPRWQRNETSENAATLYEAPWPESNFPTVKISKLISPVSLDKPLNDECLRSVVDVDVDARGRLWLLEVPNNFDCSARIVIYNLKRMNHLVSSTELTNVPAENLRALVIDQSGSRAYIGDPGDESIIAFAPEKEKWWKIKMIHGPEVPRVFSSDVAISRRNSVLYLTGSDTLDLFSINLEELWKDDGSPAFRSKSRNATVVWHGTKMGTSSGLFCDVKDGLHYFMSSERASVRWDTKLPLRAECHTIVMQNENYPCITDYAMDGQRNLWGLVNDECPFAKDSSRSPLKSRTVKIAKYPT